MIYSSRHILEIRSHLLSITSEQWLLLAMGMKPYGFNPIKTAGTGNGRLAWIINFFLPLITACAICSACSDQDDADKIRELIEKGASLAEAHDIAGIMELASEDVRAMPMDLDQRGIKGVLWRTFRYYGPLNILYPHPAVEIKDDIHEASVQLLFLIVKKEQKLKGLEGLRDDPMAWAEAIGETADLYRLRLRLTRQAGDWLVDRAFLERFTGMGFEE